MSDNRTNNVSDQRRQLGQGLVEFALLAPILLLTLMGIADFGRMFAAYSNLFNAAREGTRYGVVHPRDVSGITLAARDKVDLVDPNQVDIDVQFDSGPGTDLKDFTAVTVGDRVIVILNADVEMITPFIRVFAKQLHVETVATRTIATLREDAAAIVPPAPSTATPTPTATLTPVPKAKDGSTLTPTPTNTPTPTMIPGKVPIRIDIPLWSDAVMVTGVAEPGETVFLRDIQDPTLDLSTVVNAGGTFQFNLCPSPSFCKPLVAGHVIAVQGYGNIDYAVVEGTLIPTVTPTSTPTPTPTPTPSHQYIDLEPVCGPEGKITITVIGHQWPVDQGDLVIYWDDVPVTYVSARADFSVPIEVTVTPGLHAVGVRTLNNGRDYHDSKPFEVPCHVPQPNLVVELFPPADTGVISTYETIDFTVAVRNTGDAAANNLFWVDLYADPAVEPPSPSDLANEASIAWSAVSSLEKNDAITLTLNYLQGFAIVGGHQAYALVDSWDQVEESDEEDNVGGPVTVTVSTAGIAPTPTSNPGGPDSGAISGSTWLYLNGDIVPQGRVGVYVYDGDQLVADTLSDQDGNYLIDSVPPGTYTVIGETYIDGKLYTDTVLSVEVLNGQTTNYVTLVLH